MSEVTSTPQPEKPEYSYDILTGQMLLGRIAINSHIESGGHPEDLRELGNFLVSNENFVTPNATSEPLTSNARIDSDWTKTNYINYAKWLHRLTADCVPETKKALNQHVFKRARLAGVGPSFYPVVNKNRFGSLANLYREAKIYPTHIIGVFDDWDAYDIADYIKGLGESIGRRPTRQDLREMWVSEPTKYPSDVYIHSRFPSNGGLGRAMELAGYIVPELWSDQDYIDWGVKFMMANDEKIPTSRDMLFLSAQRLGPSSRTIMNKFDKMRDYQFLVVKTLRDRAEIVENDKQEKLRDIEIGLNSGRFPAQLFSNVSREEEKIVRRAKYLVLDTLLQESNYEAKISISTEAGKSYREMGFVRSIRKINSTTTAGDVESTALYLGVFDDIWPPDTAFMKTLRLPDQLRNRRRQRELIVA